MYQKASRLKLRFTTSKGAVNTEDLWDLNLESLNTLAKSLSKQVKESEEEDFIKTKTASNTELDLKFQIVKDVIKIKLEEAEERKIRSEKRQKRAEILELIANKEKEALGSKSLEDLKKELNDLD